MMPPGVGRTVAGKLAIGMMSDLRFGMMSDLVQQVTIYRRPAVLRRSFRSTAPLKCQSVKNQVGQDETMVQVSSKKYLTQVPTP